MNRGLVLLVALATGLTLCATSAPAAPMQVPVLVVKATWGPPEPLSDSSIDTVMQAVQRFYATASFGEIAMTYTQTPLLNIMPGPMSCFDETVQVPRLATSAGWNVGAYGRRVVYLFPDVGQVQGGCGNAFEDASGEFLPGAFPVGAVIHELGHSFGMQHAGALTCFMTGRRRSCVSNSYGDPSDVMGGQGTTNLVSYVGDFGALQKARASWITPTLVAKPGVYRLAALEEPSALPQALVIRTGSFEYWIDHREALGNDTHIDPAATKGFGVHRISGDPFATGEVPDTAAYFTPDYLMPTGKTTSSGYYTVPGKTFTLPGLFSVTALSRSHNVMTVRFRWLDTSKPTAPKITSISTGSPASITFTPSSDRGTGVDHYLLTVDKDAPQTIPGPPLPPSGVPSPPPSPMTFTLPQLSRGQHMLTLVAVDRAGNRGSAATAVVRG